MITQWEQLESTLPRELQVRGLLDFEDPEIDDEDDDEDDDANDGENERCVTLAVVVAVGRSALNG